MTELLDDLRKSWARDMRGGTRPRAAKTIRIYDQVLRDFTAWCRDGDRAPDTDALTKRAIAAWLEDRRAAGQAENTLASKFRSMRRFCHWLVEEGEIAASPMAGLEQPQSHSKPVPILTDTQVAALFKATAGTGFAERRDHALLRVLFDCGLRISECAQLGTDDVDMDAEVLFVLGKGRKPRVVPFGARTAKALDRYLRERRRHPHAIELRLWLTQRGGMSTDGLDERLRVRARQAGITGLHAHMFRHRFAHTWLADGGQEQDLKRLAGWSSDVMLRVYGSSAAVERAHDAFRRRRLGDRL